MFGSDLKMAVDLVPRSALTVTVVAAWLLVGGAVQATTTYRHTNSDGQADTEMEGIPGVLDTNDEAVTQSGLERVTPGSDANQINCHFTLHGRSRVGGRCMNLGTQRIKTCVASIIYLDTDNNDCMNLYSQQ